LGLLPVERGRVSVAGEPPLALSEALRARLGYVPQAPAQFAWLTGQAMLRYVAAFYPAFDWEYTEGLTRRWNVALNTPIAALSPGQQQRLSIIRALGSRPDLLILDEPIASLDPATRMDVIDELAREHRSRRLTLLFSSHITADLERLCDRFMVLAGGRIVLAQSTAACRELVRVCLQGDETLLRGWSYPACLRTRKARDGELVLVIRREQLRELLEQLPERLHPQVEERDLEVVLSEWMQ
jgi:ABC-2 type transport system ATP-binding protein